MTAAFLDEFRTPQPTCGRCGRDSELRKVKVSGKAETLCKTCRVTLDCEPVWVDHKEYRMRSINDSDFWGV